MPPEGPGLSPFQQQLAWWLTVFGATATAANALVDVCQKLF